MTTFNDAKVEHFFEIAKYFQKNLINLFCSLLYSIFIVYLSYIVGKEQGAGNREQGVGSRV